MSRDSYEETLVCTRCGAKIRSAEITALSIVCPHCKRLI